MIITSNSNNQAWDTVIRSAWYLEYHSRYVDSNIIRGS
jgi:hypothetical protein